VLLTGDLSAQSLLWDANGTGSGQTDGSGTWNTTSANWWTGSTNQTWNNAANNIAMFGNGNNPNAATVTVSGTVNAAGLQFNAVGNSNNPINYGSYILSGGTISLTDGAFISTEDFTSNTTGTTRLTINSILAGSNITFAKSGLETAFMNIGGNNTWTGTLTLANVAGGGGTFLNITNVNSIKTLGAIDVQSGSTLVIGYLGTDTVNMPISLSGTGSGSRGAIRFDRNRTLSGPVTLTGNAGISVNVANTTEVTPAAPPVGTIAGDIGELGGSRSLTINTSSTALGTIVLSGNNTFTGGVVLTAANLRLGSSGALNASGVNVLSFTNNTVSKTVTLDGNSATVAGLSTLGSTDVVTIQNANANAATLTVRNTGTHIFRGVLADGTGGGALSLIKSGTGTQELTRASTYTGSTTVAAGTLLLNFAASGAPASNILGSSSALIANGGTLSMAGSASAANSQTVNGLTVAAGFSTISLTPNTTPQNLVLNLGTITALTGGQLNFVLPGGTQSASNGILTTTGNDASGILGGWATVNGNDWATVSGGNIIAYTGYTDITNFSGASSQGPLPNSPNANVRIIDGGTSGNNIQLGNAGGTTDINTLVQSATGNPAIIGSVSGDTLRLGIHGGILLTTNAQALTIGAVANNGSVLTAGGSTIDTAGQLIFTDQVSNQTTTVNSGIRNNGTGVVSLVKNGPGLLILAGSSNSNYSGGTYLNGGIVRISADSALGVVPGSAQAGNLTFNGGTLQWGAALTLNANRGITLLAGGGTLDLQTQSTTYAGSITGPGSLTKRGNGLLVLSGTSNYSGETTITAGVLAITNSQALGSNLGGTTVANLAQLRLDSNMTVTGENLTINGNGGNNNGALQANTGITATWTGNIFIGTNLSRIGGQNNSLLNVTGVIQNGLTAGNGIAISTSGNGGVVQLSGMNTYTGATQIVRGTLRLGASNSLPKTTTLTVYTAGTVTETTMFDLNGFDQEIAGLTSVLPNGSNDVVRVNNSNSTTTSTLTVNQAVNNTFNGKITGNLALVKDGAGTLTLTNTYNTTTPVASTSNYSGKTTIRAGTLALSGTGNITGTPWIQVDQAATFSIAGRTAGNYTLNNQIVSGRGTVNGSLIVSGTTGYISPGDTTGSLLVNAGNGTGELTFNNLTLTGGTPTLRALFQIGGTNSNLADILAAGDPTYFANAATNGLYDSLQVNDSLSLNAGSTIRVDLLGGYVPAFGDVFNLLDWVTTLNPDADGIGGAGAFTLADLDLTGANSILASNGWYLNTDHFLQHGIVYVAAIPEPSRALLLILGCMVACLRRRR